MVNNKERWVAFYSGTGSEIKSLVESGHIPDLVYTDNTDAYVANMDFFYERGITHAYIFSVGKKSYDYLEIDDLVTLHGWMNIIPAEICDKYNIYNGHPGLITRYPELKGKDPQDKVANSGKTYPFVGSVIHKVTSEIDGGQVVIECEQENYLHSNNLKHIGTNQPGELLSSEVNNLCRECSLETWKYFLGCDRDWERHYTKLPYKLTI